MSHTLQLTINGTLGLQGGDNPVVWPTAGAMPAPTADGVRAITLTQGAVGTFFFRQQLTVAGQGNVAGELFTKSYVFVKTIVFSTAQAGVVATRLRGYVYPNTNGLSAPASIVSSDPLNGAMYQRAPFILPPGSAFTFETDDAGVGFAGNNVAGPHNLVIEYEFVNGLDELCCAMAAVELLAAQQPE